MEEKVAASVTIIHTSKRNRADAERLIKDAYGGLVGEMDDVVMGSYAPGGNESTLFELVNNTGQEVVKQKRISMK